MGLNTIDRPYLYWVAEGRVTNHTPWIKLGFNPDIGTSEEDLWTVGGTYTWPTSAMQMEVYSSSNSDASGGTGVTSLRITYLDSNLVEKTEDIVPTGTTAKATVATDIYRVQSFRALTVGTGMVAAGNINLRHIDDTPVYSQIAQGYTRARNIVYTVPAGKTLFVTSSTIGVYGATKGIRVTSRSTYDSTLGALNHFAMNSEYVMGNGIITRNFEMPTKIPSGTRMKTSAIADAAGAVVSVVHRGWIENA